MSRERTEKAARLCPWWGPAPSPRRPFETAVHDECPSKLTFQSAPRDEEVSRQAWRRKGVWEAPGWQGASLLRGPLSSGWQLGLSVEDWPWHQSPGLSPPPCLQSGLQASGHTTMSPPPPALKQHPASCSCSRHLQPQVLATSMGLFLTSGKHLPCLRAPVRNKVARAVLETKSQLRLSVLTPLHTQPNPA